MDGIDRNQEPEAASPEELTSLYEVAKAVGATLDLRQAIYNVLEVLAHRMDMRRGTVTLLSPVKDIIQTEVAYGMSADAVRRGRYKLGEGVVGHVVETGEPMVVPHINTEPLFLNRTRSRKEDRE